jgi:hypothetical protein
MRRAIRVFAAAVLAMLFSALVLPACVLKIGKGGVGGGGDWSFGGAGGEGSTGGADGAGSTGGAGGEGADGTVDWDAFAEADQQELGIRAVTAAYAANVTASLVEAQFADPEAADPELVQQLIEEYAPAGWDAALEWISSVDLSTLPLSKGALVDPVCLDEPYLCKANTWCPFGEGNVGCGVTQCGTGKCPWCPFGGNLIFKAWCAYGCVRNSDSQVVGGAFILRTIFNNYNGPWCVKF